MLSSALRRVRAAGNEAWRAPVGARLAQQHAAKQLSFEEQAAHADVLLYRAQRLVEAGEASQALSDVRAAFER